MQFREWSFLLRSVARIVLFRVLKSDFEREFLILLKENEILKRKQRRVALAPRDRAFFLGILSVSRRLIEKVRIVQPATILSWHRRIGIRLLNWKQPFPGRKPISTDAKNLILEMKRSNPRWGVERISGELKKLKVKVSRTSVRRILRAAGFDPSKGQRGKGWFSFLRSQKNRIYACDFFHVQSLFFKRLCVFFIIDIHTKEIVHFAVTRNQTQEWFMNHIRSVFTFMEKLPDYLIADRDKVFGNWLGHLLESTFGVKVKRIPHLRPWFNCYAERMVKTFRDELLDHVLVYNEKDLHLLLAKYVEYYNHRRVHSSIGFDAPLRAFAPARGTTVDRKRVRKVPVLNGLITDFEWVA